MSKVIVRIKGGLGNQLFCYAAARRLALVNGVELVIDDVTGFIRDRGFKRQYALNNFNIDARKATSAERLEPFERYRRGFLKYISRVRPFKKKCYIEQEGNVFDARLLSLKVKGNIYLDGYWQSEKYFKDVEEVICKDLKMPNPTDRIALSMAENMFNSPSVAVHVRWFDPSDGSSIYNLSADYYQKAISLMEKRINSPRYFLFSDNPEAAKAKINFPKDRMICVSNNQIAKSAYLDFWLMRQCKHFIIANSTFSWWGAWLSEYKSLEKIIITRDKFFYRDTIPKNWIII